MNSFREVHFQDPRSPHDIRCELEREMMMLFQPMLEGSRLKYCTTGTVNGVPCRALLQFEAAGLLSNSYSYRLEADGTGLTASALTENQAYLKGWFELWTRKYSTSAPPTSREDLTSRYEKIASDALAAESHLESVTAVQHEILNCLRRGATFSTAHKEGGSVIRCQHNRFLCADYGDSNRIQEFNTEATFLAFLRKFYQWETSRNMRPDQASELAARMQALHVQARQVPQRGRSPSETFLGDWSG